MAANPTPPTPSNGIPYADVLSRLATVSSRLSDNLRTFGVGTVVFCWGLFTASKGLAKDVAVHHRAWIVLTAAIAVLGLLFDLLQAIAGYWISDQLRRKMERDKQATGFYNGSSLLYRTQTFFFVVKSILMPIAAGSIIVLLFMMVL